MSRSLTIGSETFLYPEEGTKAGWGEVAADWAEAATNTLSDLSGPNDILVTSATILNNQSSAVDVGVGNASLSFSSTSVRRFVVSYSVVRGANVESGEMEGIWDGSDWIFAHTFIGDAGMDFEITTAGQIQYFSDDSSDGEIKFRGKTIDQI